MKRDPCQNFHKKRAPKKVILSSDFAGVKAGQRLYVGTPQVVADYISTIPHRQSETILKMRNRLARRHKCDAMCPASTAIFVRIAAEYTIHEIENGKPIAEVIPFWRVIEGRDKIAKRLAIDPQWIDDQRAAERN